MDHRRGGGAARGSRPRRPGPARPRQAAGPAGVFDYAPLTALEIHQAIPVGSRRARGQRDWLAALTREIELAGLRPVFQRNILAVSRVLMRFASWADRTTRPTRERICRLAGRPGRPDEPLSPATWKRVRRWLEDHGYLGTVRHGWTAALPSRTRPLVMDGAPNEAAVYVLCVPRPRRRGNDQRQAVTAGQARTEPLTSSTAGRRSFPPARARELPRTTAADDGSAGFVVAFLRSQIAELRRGPGKTLTDRAVLAIARPFLAERWSPADLAYAIGHDPVTGKQHRTLIRTVRQPASWIAWRLTRWCADPETSWKSWHAHGRWDHQAWPIPASSPSARSLAAAAAAQARLREVVPLTPGTGRGPSAEYRSIRDRLKRTR